MRATLGIISVVSFLLMLGTAEQLGIVFVLSLVAFACSTIELTNKLTKEKK